MEKIVTKIGDVTIERKVSKTSLQKFSADATHRGILPQSAARSTLDDLVKSLPQSEVLKTDAPSPQHGVNARTGKALNAQTQMGKSLDVQSEMEQKFTLPKGISWDCKSSENSRQRTGNWNQLDSRAGAKIQFNNTCQSQKRIDQTGAMQPDMSRFGGISIERKRARVPENEPEEGQLSGNSRFSSGSGAQNVEVFNRDQSNLPGKGFPYPDIERLTQGGLTIEKKTNSQADPKQFRANSHNSINSSAQRFTGKPTFSSKSPIQISSDEDKGTAEDYGMKDADFEEDYDNETEDDEEEEEEISERNRFFNSESVPLQAEREGKQQENRSGSPIVLSSEDDEKNDEDVMVMDESQLINLNSKSDNLSVKSKSSESIVIDDLRDSSAKNIESGGASRIKVPQASKLGCLEPKSESDILSSDVELDSDDVKALDDSNELGEEFSEMEEEEQMKETISEGEKLKEENEQSSPEDEADEPKNAQEDEESELKSSETELPPSDASEAEDEKTKADDVANDIVCDDLMELMKKGEIEGEVEDEKEYETEEEGTDKKGEKRKAEEEDGGNEKTETKSKSKKKKSEKTEEGESKDEDDKNIDKSKVTSANLRKNIREVMDETKLDEATLSAQRQEAERLKRLQDQQRIIRELQKQIVLNRNQKFQGRVMSLLQGNSQTSILKTSSASTPQSTTQSKSSNHVLVKLSNGQQTSLNNKKMLELLKNAKNKVALTKPAIPKTLLKQGMVSPSVSIAPIAKKEPPVDDKKKKKGDVVTLSSDSEDDCIVLSEEDESEPEEDPTNSGMHTSDKYNVPDDQGRVIVNVGHPESESDIYLAPQIARIIKPHQIGGIRFLYDNVIESVDRFQSSTGFGCILAHSMGLGKTLQIVSFSDIFLRYTSAKTILCIMPINTIQNWLAEFNMWLPKENNSSQEVRCRDFDLYIVNESLKNINSRSKVILDWHRNGGVLLMGYELFRLLSLKKSYKSKKKKKETDEKEDEAKNKELMEEVYAALVRPGPDLVICDEGHRIKNSHATTSQALKQIRTKRRIVLTGYPLQNNLLEYWCMVDFVRPNYLGSKTEFSNMFERPIQNGQCIDSTPQDKRLMRYRAHVLHSLLEGFVQRRSHAVLQSTLPEKEEYVLLLRFTPFQRKLYDTFMNEVVRTVAVPNPLKAFAVCCKIWNHPDVLYNFLKKKGEEIDLDLEEALPPSMQQPANYPFGQTPPDGSTQFPPSQAVQPWPKRGPGSRGGKVRQCAMNRRPGRGRKPAATVSPNLTSEKKDQDPEFNPSSYPSNYPDFQHQNSTESMMDSNRNRNFGRPFSQYPTSDYGSHSSFSGSSYESKNPLENLEDLSSGDFQSKRFYPQQSDSGMQNNFSNPSCMQQNTNYPQSMNQSGNADMNSGFNRNDTSKPFQYNQNYNSGYYPGGNYQSQKTPEFEQTNKQPNFNRNNQSTDPYYQNTQYPDGRDPSMNYNMQSNSNMDYQYGSGNSDQNYQQGNMNKHFQNSNPGYNDSSCNPNYQNSRPADSNYQSDFQGPNFQNSSSGFNQTSQERDSGFNKQQEYWSGSNWFDASKGSGGFEL
ncbi:UNVERIFIED_CONTAM: hypothetical protein PYX00_004349 [Menopon gallinae]|uniref:Helicase ATP-binding domain-containing protein n=1 Tax=Menopon gallinae TaxID=328185 RepID=A0AAW2I4X9_9NEOP